MDFVEVPTGIAIDAQRVLECVQDRVSVLNEIEEELGVGPGLVENAIDQIRSVRKKGEKKMQVGMTVSYNLVLSSAEIVLVCRALRGALRKDEVATAVALADQIALGRVKGAEQLAAEMAKLKANVEGA